MGLASCSLAASPASVVDMAICRRWQQAHHHGSHNMFAEQFRMILVDQCLWLIMNLFMIDLGWKWSCCALETLADWGAFTCFNPPICQLQRWSLPGQHGAAHALGMPSSFPSKCDLWTLTWTEARVVTETHATWVSLLAILQLPLIQSSFWSSSSSSPTFLDPLLGCSKDSAVR